MPLLSTRGSLSSRGFGQFTGGRPRTLVTYTFPAGSSVFTVPATTSILISAVGAGADGSPAVNEIRTNGYANIAQIALGQPWQVGTVALTYDQLKAQRDVVLNAMQGGGVTYFTKTTNFSTPNNLCIVYTTPNNTEDVVAGTVVRTTVGESLTGPIVYNSTGANLGFSYGARYSYRYVAGATTGAATTGFGLTFPGGSGGASSTTTFSNVAVVPNQTYVIQNNKSLTITYIA
jgi:hypothetical protein